MNLGLIYERPDQCLIQKIPLYSFLYVENLDTSKS